MFKNNKLENLTQLKGEKMNTVKGWGSGIFQVGFLLWALSGCNEGTYFPPQNGWGNFGLFLLVIGALIYMGGYFEQDKNNVPIKDSVIQELDSEKDNNLELFDKDFDIEKIKEQLKTLEELLDDGILNQEEYEIKRKSLIDKI